MNFLTKYLLLVPLFFCLACSSDSDSEVIPPEEEIVEEEEPIIPAEVIDFISVESIADIPVNGFSITFVHEDKLYALSGEETYLFDFSLSTWTLLATDTNTPSTRFDKSTINFIREGKWYVVNYLGVYTFDFELTSWEFLDRFNLDITIFSVEGYYEEADNAVYFIDEVNRAENIFKYDLLTNMLSFHSTFNSNGNFFPISKNALEINDVKHIVSLSSYGEMKIAKFNDDFTNFETINQLYTLNTLEDGVACQYGDYIIFGLGGSFSEDRDRTSLNFYYYNTIEDTFGEMNNTFYEICRSAHLITYNNDYYLIGGLTVVNNEYVLRKTIEKLSFAIIQP